jgi:hypothetical protein
MHQLMTKPIRFVKSALLKKRLDQVVDKLGLDCDQWGRLCRIMLPEEFAAPSARPMATPTLPGPARVEIYQQRVEKNESLFDFNDKKHQD